MSYDFFNKYPYTDFHELNLDYVLTALKDLAKELKDFVLINAIKYADPIQWDITKQYEKNTVVIDPLTGTAYISVDAVPAGVSLTRPEYWTVIFDLGLFITKANQNFTLNFESTTTTTATFNTIEGGWVVWNETLYKALVNITAGDAYVVGSNITRYTCEQGCADIVTMINTLLGDLDDLNTTDKSNVVAAINEVLSTLASVAGDLNDLNTTDKSNLVAAINEVLSTLASVAGDLNDLNTTDKSNLVAAINEVLSTLASVAGDLNSLNTTDKSNIVAAINEVLTTLATVAGDLNDLNTTDKSSLVNAINEVLATITTITGQLSDLNTTDKSNIIAAINEVLAAVGDLTSLNTTDKSNLVAAVNEVLATLITTTGDLATLDTVNKSDLVAAINEVYGMAGSGTFRDVNLSDYGLSAGSDISDIVNGLASPLVRFVLDKNYTMHGISNKYVNIEGAGNTITLNGSYLINNDSSHPYDIRLQNVTIDYNDTSYNGAMILTHGGVISCRNCTFQNDYNAGAASACIGSGGVGYAAYIGCTFSTIRQGIYDLNKGLTVIYACTFDVINIGILLTSSENTIISNCTFDNVAEYGVLMGSTSYDAHSNHILITDCTFEDQTGSSPAYNKPITYANQLPDADGYFVVRNCTFTNTSGAVSIQGTGAHYEYRAYALLEGITIVTPQNDPFYFHNADVTMKKVTITQDKNTYDQMRIRFVNLEIDGYELTYTAGVNLSRFITIDAVTTKHRVNAKNIYFGSITFNDFFVGGQATGDVEIIIENQPGDFSVGNTFLTQSELYRKVYLRSYPTGLSSPETRAYPNFGNAIGRIFIAIDGTAKFWDGTNTKTITTT